MLVARAGQSLTGAVPVRNLAQQARSIHIPHRVLRAVKPTNLLHRTRTFLTQFITHLQTPPAVSRSVHSSASIRQSLSLPVRIALSRPLRAPCLPRAPHLPGNVTHVGLGTARNFSSGRPIFQHLVENVPVAGRAFYEMDWDVKMRSEKNTKVRRPKKSARKVKVADKLQPRHENSVNDIIAVETRDEFDHYFPASSVTVPTTTYLQIPLAPTPTARVPLSSEPSPHLLPIPELAKQHASHSKHSIRVSSLFRRLDAARVWEKGASCETFGDPSGLCTILRITFTGWTEAMVKNILGDAGKGWCTLQEIRQEESLPNSLASTPPRTFSPEPPSSDVNNMTFVMPELEFSTSLSSPSPWPEPSTSYAASLGDTDTNYSFPSSPQSVWDEDNTSDISSLESYNTTEQSIEASSPSSQNWLLFSSNFADKSTFVDQEYTP